MNKNVIKIDDSNFDSLVLFPQKTAAVFFSAKWSETSAAVRPVFEAAAEKFSPPAVFCEIDVDENPAIRNAYRVRRLPAILIFAEGNLNEALTGAINELKLNEKLERLTATDRTYRNIADFSRKIARRIDSGVGRLLSELFEKDL